MECVSESCGVREAGSEVLRGAVLAGVLAAWRFAPLCLSPRDEPQRGRERERESCSKGPAPNVRLITIRAAHGSPNGRS